MEPEVWLLDEPFSALDPLIRKELQGEFLRLRAAREKRSIVFITHDFDEALRLSDRIAIMNEGEIVQIGDAEELVAHPANAHVAEFTKDAPRAKLLRARSIMDPPDANAGDARVAEDALLGDIAGEVLQQNRAVQVADAGGKVIGSLRREKLIEVLFA